MKKLCILILALAMVLSVTTVGAVAETKTITLGNDVIANTTPFGNVEVNQRYKLAAGMVVTVLGEYDGWLVVKYSDEFGSLFVETGEHKLGTGTQIPTAPDKIPTAPGNADNTTGKVIRGVVGDGWQVWSRFKPEMDPDNPGDEILHQGDVVEIIGDTIMDEDGNEYYPIRVKKGDYYVPRYVTAKYIDIILE